MEEPINFRKEYYVAPWLSFFFFFFLRGGWGEEDLYTVNPVSPIKPLGGGGGLVYFKPIWGSVNRDGRLIWEGQGLFDLETTMVSVLHKELEYKVEKLKYKTFWGHSSSKLKDQNQIRTSSW